MRKQWYPWVPLKRFPIQVLLKLMRSVIRARLADHLEGFSQRQAARETERAMKLLSNRELARRYMREVRW